MLAPAWTTAALADGACRNPATALGVARIVEIDTSGAPIYGTATRYVAEERFLAPMEVVLTFDDGPSPTVTPAILTTLDQFCTKATFFQVGRMALAHPQIVAQELARGHTIAAHTWSHPLSLNQMKREAAIDEIERGFAAITLAAGQPIAPFFRFPGLGDGKPLLDYLQFRRIATFTVDVISDDSFISSTERLVQTTLSRIAQRQGGIVLFHDIKPQTARALPTILTELKARGYRIVHLRAKQTYEADAQIIASLEAQAAASGRGSVQPARIPATTALDAVPVVRLAPETSPVRLALRHPMKQGPDAGAAGGERPAAAPNGPSAGAQPVGASAVGSPSISAIVSPRAIPAFTTTVHKARRPPVKPEEPKLVGQ